MSKAIKVGPIWKTLLFFLFPILSFRSDLPENSLDSLFNISTHYFNAGKYDSANFYFNKLNAHYRKKEYDIGLASGYNYVGFGHYNLGNLDSSIYYYFQALDRYQSISDSTGISSVLLNLGIVFKEQGNYEKSIEYLLNALTRFEQKNDSLYTATCYNTLANVNYRQRNYNDALNYHFKALNIRKSLEGQKRSEASSLNNIGLVYQELEQFDSAIYYYEKSLKIKRELNLSSLKSTLNNIGTILLDLKKPNEAKSYFIEARKVNSSPNDESKAVTLNGLGNLYNQLGNQILASKYLDSALYIIESQKLKELKRDNLKQRIELYKYSNPSLALSLSQELFLVNDSLYNRQRAEALAEMQTKYETEKKEQSISLLSKEKDLQSAEIQLNRLWISVLIVSILLTLTIVLLINYKFRRERKNKHKIETLMQELHHRVKNNLQLLSSIFSLQSKVLKDEYALDAVRSGENRVNAMAIVHQQLYQQSGSRSVNLKHFITRLVDELASSYNYQTEVNDIILSIDDYDIDVDKVIPIGLIVNELASNSFKYAFSVAENPRLSIQITKTNEELVTKVSDNGPGFKTISESKKSMGLNIVETLGRQLKAKIDWITDGKVEFTMTMKLK